MNPRDVPSTTQPGDMARSRLWAGRFISDPAGLPISFNLGGKGITGIPAKWKPVFKRRLIDANIVETVFEGNDPKTGLNLRAECTEYRDYPVVEWVAWFTNNGDKPTPVLRDILPLDGEFEGASPLLHYNNGDGDVHGENGYTPAEASLRAGASLRFAPNGGRPCDSAFPYYRILFEEGGLTLAIGWPAQWSATFKGIPGGVHVRAGQEKTNLRLLPGESIRTPRITILSWTGDASRGVNLWRRWYLAHLLPRPDGRPLRPLLAVAATDEGEEFTAATEKNQLQYIEKFKRRGIPFDVWWIDAGWYPCRNKENQRRWTVCGTWKPDPERFPRGMKAVSNRAAREGAALLLWFEPEKVRSDTELDRKHPEWLLRIEKPFSGDISLLFLGNPECRQWLTDRVCKLIKDNGIRIYRQDHNFPPLDYWRENEAEDRQGVNENLHVQGYLKFWDDLLARNPGLWIDSCASGGRRNDLESMRRSVPLHYSDYGYGNQPVIMSFHQTLYEWFPYFKEFTLSYDIGGKARYDRAVDSYAYYCAMAPMLWTSLDIRRDDYDYALCLRLIDIWRRASGLILNGDYYPLTTFHRSPEKWVVWQFDCPESDCGLIQGVRLPACRQESISVQPRGISADAAYQFENLETGEKQEESGSALIQKGFRIRLPKRSGALWFYRKKE